MSVRRESKPRGGLGDVVADRAGFARRIGLAIAFERRPIAAGARGEAGGLGQRVGGRPPAPGRTGPAQQVARPPQTPESPGTKG